MTEADPDPRVAALTAFWGYAPNVTQPARDLIENLERAGLTIGLADELSVAAGRHHHRDSGGAA